jgi:uncharacterized cupin superfamily protein
VITHWDELTPRRQERGHIAAEWTSLSGSNSDLTGVKRIRIDPGMWSTPLHLEGCEEEIFYVLDGEGISVQDAGDGLEAFAVGVGDCLVHRALEHAHTLQAGPAGLDVLAFGQRSYAANTLLPRAGVSWLGTTWVLQGAPDDHPWAREAAVGPPEALEISARPERIVNVADVEVRERHRTTVVSDWRDLGRAAGSERTGVKHITVHPGGLSAPPHCHSAEEEIFVVLEGEGTLELLPVPASGAFADVFPAEPASSHAVRAGSTVCRPPGTRIAHAFRAGEESLTLLAYGTRVPNDIAYYPRSGKVYLRGVGVIGRLEPLEYWEGED